MAACPLAGVIWQHVHYLVGLQRLGHEVYYVEDTARAPYNPTTHSAGEDYSYAARILQGLSEQFGFRERWAYRPRYLAKQMSAGLSCEALRELYSEADAILNVCGSHELHDDLLRSERILLVESDPGFLQIKLDRDDAEAIAFAQRHHRLFTFGENIGTEGFPIPLHGFDWLATRQPVVTDFWDTSGPPPAGAAFTTITNWGVSASLEWRGKPYLWSKSLEFMKFVDAPALTGEAFELVTDIPDPDTAALFRRNCWRLLPTDSLNLDPDAYRKYVQHSRGEFTATKQIVVALNTGWFSDRSACYLAAGRPVITQETGFTRLYGGERGLFGFTTIEDVVEAVRRIAADYPAHSDAAREIAREHFEAEKVLKSLLDRANL
jgi:hypothetical protein